MGNAMRNQPSPTGLYPESRISPTYSHEIVYLYITCIGIVGVSFLTILPGFRGLSRIWTFIRVCAALWIAGLLLICNFSAWYADTICTRTPYKAYAHQNTPQEIEAEIGLYIGLRGINITLIEKDCGHSPTGYIRPFPDETIYYNEHFSWSDPWSQGRLDFGKFGGIFRQQYREAKYRGTPLPITSIAEFFIIDGEQILWYRKFRQAGWYTHILMWIAFVTHIFSILLFTNNIRLGAWQMALTGSLILMACLSYSTIIINDPILQIHFPDQTLVPRLTPIFWVNLGTGVATLLTGFAILILEKVIPRKISSFFNIDHEADETEQSNKEYRNILRRRTVCLEETEENDFSNIFLRDTFQRRVSLTDSSSEIFGKPTTVGDIHQEPEQKPREVSQERPPKSELLELTQIPVPLITSHELDIEIQVTEIRFT